jgi:hypothetical protein
MFFWDAPSVVRQIDSSILEETVASFFRMKGHSRIASDKIVHY